MARYPGPLRYQAARENEGEAVAKGTGVCVSSEGFDYLLPLEYLSSYTVERVR